MPRLLLFDIDSTLIDSKGVGAQALYRACDTFLGNSDALRRLSLAGQVDWGIWREALGAEGYSHEEVDAHLPELQRLYIAELVRVLADPTRARPKPLPGVRPLLERLIERDDTVLGLLTGNVEAAAWLKLGCVGLDHFFCFGAFGSDAPTRAALPAIAVERARPFAGGYTFSRKEIVVIGDTIHDVRCGAEMGVCAIGFATGSTDAATLRAAGADHVFDMLADTEAVLATLVGGL